MKFFSGFYRRSYIKGTVIGDFLNPSKMMKLRLFSANVGSKILESYRCLTEKAMGEASAHGTVPLSGLYESKSTLMHVP
jgi:hypothetical protein